MKQNTQLYQRLFCILLLFILISCKKNHLSEMKTGKYEMVNIRTFPDGQKDTIRCTLYGPRLLNDHYYFSPEIMDTVVDQIDIYISKRKKFVKGPFKRARSWNFRFYSYKLPDPGYFGGHVDSYDIQKSKLTLNYTNNTVNYNTLQQEPSHTGFVEFNWVEL